jgi:hypothetical protein
LKYLIYLGVLIPALAKTPASTCNIPGPPADATPAIRACLTRAGSIEFDGGNYRIGSTLDLENWESLVSVTMQTTLRAGAELTGPMIRVDGKSSTRIAGIQFVLPTSSAATAAIEYNNSEADTLFNVIEDNFIVEEHAPTTLPMKTGILMRSNSTGVSAMYYNIVQRNRIFNFHNAIRLEAGNLLPGSNLAPVSGNWFTNNVTSGIINIYCKAGCQQNFFTNHFCNGFVTPSRQVCLAAGTMDSASALGVAAENQFVGKVDMGPDQDASSPNAAYLLAANTRQFSIEAEDNQGDTSVDLGTGNSINIKQRDRREFYGKAAAVSVNKSLDSVLIGGLVAQGSAYICNVSGNYAAMEVIPGGVGAGVRVLKGTGCVKGQPVVPSVVSSW